MENKIDNYVKNYMKIMKKLIMKNNENLKNFFLNCVKIN